MRIRTARRKCRSIRKERRSGYPWSPAVLDLLRHVEREGCTGAPRALGLDEQGREISSFIEEEVAAQRRPGQPGGGALPEYVWRDDVLVQLGGLVRAFHDAAAPIGTAEKARRFRLLLDAYGVEPESGIVRAAVDRTRNFPEHLLQLVADGSEREVSMERSGVLDELARDLAWMGQNAAALVNVQPD